MLGQLKDWLQTQMTTQVFSIISPVEVVVNACKCICYLDVVEEHESLKKRCSCSNRYDCDMDVPSPISYVVWPAGHSSRLHGPGNNAVSLQVRATLHNIWGGWGELTYCSTWLEGATPRLRDRSSFKPLISYAELRPFGADGTGRSEVGHLAMGAMHTCACS